MSVDDDLKAKLRRYVTDLDAEEKARRQADDEEEIQRKEFLVAFRAKMKKTVEPALESVCQELRELGRRSAGVHPLAGQDTVTLSIGLEARLTYAAQLTQLQVEVAIQTKRTERAYLDLSEVTPDTVKRHIEALLTSANNKPLGLGWAGAG